MLVEEERGIVEANSDIIEGSGKEILVVVSQVLI